MNLLLANSLQEGGGEKIFHCSSPNMIFHRDVRSIVSGETRWKTFFCEPPYQIATACAKGIKSIEKIVMLVAPAIKDCFEELKGVLKLCKKISNSAVLLDPLLRIYELTDLITVWKTAKKVWDYLKAIALSLSVLKNSIKIPINFFKIVAKFNRSLHFAFKASIEIGIINSIATLIGVISQLFLDIRLWGCAGTKSEYLEALCSSAALLGKCAKLPASILKHVAMINPLAVPGRALACTPVLSVISALFSSATVGISCSRLCGIIQYRRVVEWKGNCAALGLAIESGDSAIKRKAECLLGGQGKGVSQQNMAKFYLQVMRKESALFFRMERAYLRSYVEEVCNSNDSLLEKVTSLEPRSLKATLSRLYSASGECEDIEQSRAKLKRVVSVISGRLEERKCAERWEVVSRAISALSALIIAVSAFFTAGLSLVAIGAALGCAAALSSTVKLFWEERRRNIFFNQISAL